VKNAKALQSLYNNIGVGVGRYYMPGKDTEKGKF